MSTLLLMIQVKYSHRIVMKKVSPYIFVICFFIPILLVGVSINPVFAQDNSSWSPQQRIPGYDNDTWPPILIADQNRMVHAFSNQWLNKSEGSDVRAIIYNRWIQGQGWTHPVDILLSPLKNDARLLDARLDQTGIVHIIFWGGDNTEANIYYSEASVTEAGNSNAWLSPILIAENAQDPENGVIFTDDQNDLVALFAGRSQGNGLYSASSNDRGETWSKPMLIFNTHNRNYSINNLRIFKSNTGWLHAIWNEVTTDGQGRGIYYSKIKTDDTNWSTPKELARAETGYGTNTPAIIEYHNVVYAFYNLGGIILQRLNTDGQNWTYPEQLFSHHVGVNGSLSLVVDGNDELHIFFGQRIPGSPDIHGMWHSVFGGTKWSQPEAVISGPLISDPAGNRGFDPYMARAVVSKGNVLLVTWRSDPAAGDNGVWYSFKILDIVEVPIISQPTFIPTPSMVQTTETETTRSITSPPNETPTPNEIESRVEVRSGIPSASLILTLGIPAMFSIIIIAAIIFIHKRSVR